MEENEKAVHMTKREWFAGKALVGLLSSPKTINGKAHFDQEMMADLSYKIADAMIAEGLKNEKR